MPLDQVIQLDRTLPSDQGPVIAVIPVIPSTPLNPMQLPLLASTFLTVFVAELGDKTQLTIVTISGTSSNTLAVFLGSAGALVLASLLGALAGGSLSSLIPPAALQLAASLGFLVIGSRLLIRVRQEAS